MSAEIKSLVEEINKEFTEFKKAQESGRNDLADKINKGISALEERLAATETAINRSSFIERVDELKSTKDVLKACKSAEFREFILKAQPGTFFQKADVTNASTNGVFPIVDQLVARVIADSSPIAQLVQNVSLGSGSPYTKIFNLGGSTAAWVGETGSRTGTDGNGTGKVEIAAHEIYAYPKITLAAYEDSFYDVESELLWDAADEIARKVNHAILHGLGDGSNQPTGLLRATPAAAGSHAYNRLNLIAGDDATITFENLVDMEAALPQIHKASAAFLMNAKTAAALRKLESEDGVKYWEQSYQMGTPNRILGYPVYISPDMPDVGANNVSVLLANFQQYATLVNRVGVTIQKDALTQPGYVKFYVRARYGSKMTNGLAGIALEHAAS